MIDFTHRWDAELPEHNCAKCGMALMDFKGQVCFGASNVVSIHWARKRRAHDELKRQMYGSVATALGGHINCRCIINEERSTENE